MPFCSRVDPGAGCFREHTTCVKRYAIVVSAAPLTLFRLILSQFLATMEVMNDECRMFPRFCDRYGIRIVATDLYHLRRLAAAFSFLPYENVTKILKHARCNSSGSKLRQADEVMEDHLRWNTGGTCFSLCNAFLKVLHETGYDAWIAMGDMHYGRNIHCAIIVRLDQDRYLLDPGYLLHEPILLPAEGMQTHIRTPMNLASLWNEGDDLFSLTTQEGGKQKWRYRLSAWPTPEEEFVIHWIHSFSLNSLEHVMMSRVEPSGRVYFRKNSLEHVSPKERRKVRLDGACAQELASIFHIPPDLILQAQHALLDRGSRPLHRG